MTDRITSKDARGAFSRLARAMGKSETFSDSPVGMWRLDHNSAYGGYQIQEVINDAYGITCPMGERRMSAREFVDACNFAIRALGIQARNA